MWLSVAFCSLFLCFWSALTLPLNATVISDHLKLGNDSPLSPLNWWPVCVSPEKQPAWSGSMSSTHCTMALLNFKLSVHQYGIQNYVFYSQEFVKDGIEGGWSLPIGFISGDCALELRMAKDFGDDVLPLRNQGYFPGSSRQLAEKHDWPDILDQFESLVSSCVWGSPLTGPGWARAGNNMIVLLLPTDSEMRKRWLPLEQTVGVVNSSRYLTIT